MDSRREDITFINLRFLQQPIGGYRDIHSIEKHKMNGRSDEYLQCDAAFDSLTMIVKSIDDGGVRNVFFSFACKESGRVLRENV